MVGYFVEAIRLLSAIDVITIAEVHGRAHGPGSELAVQCDVRSAGPDALFSQVENSIGVFPAASVVPFLTKLIGRARTFEYVLAAKRVDAKTAEKIRWVNTAYDRVREMRSRFPALAERIALFPRQSLIATEHRTNYDRSAENDVNNDVATINKLRVIQVAERLATKSISLKDDGFTKNAFELACLMIWWKCTSEVHTVEKAGPPRGEGIYVLDRRYREA